MLAACLLFAGGCGSGAASSRGGPSGGGPSGGGRAGASTGTGGTGAVGTSAGSGGSSSGAANTTGGTTSGIAGSAASNGDGGSARGGSAASNGDGGSARGGSAASKGDGGAAQGGSAQGGSAQGGRFARGGRAGMPGTGGTRSDAGSGAGGNATGGSGGAATGGQAGDIVVPDGYALVWHDEFDVDGPPDPKNWKFETGFVRNEEDQWYQKDNATVSGGLLVIEARQERVTNPNYTGSGDWKTSRKYAEYTSSSLYTSGLQSWQYGRFELRARIPTASGMWPAWWTLGVSGEWPSNGEIDIMEFYQNKVLANVACGTSTRWQAKWDSASQSLSSLGAGWSSEFHVWRMDWDDQNIVLYLDDKVMNTTRLSDMLNADGTSPFEQKAYMLINLALGGSNGGSLSGTTFPQRYEVDYVRVFQKL